MANLCTKSGFRLLFIVSVLPTCTRSITAWQQINDQQRDYSLNKKLSCQLTTLTIHNSFSLSLRIKLRPTSFTNLSHHRLPSTGSGLTPLALWLDRFFWASRVFCFFLFLHYSFLFGPMRQIKLPLCQRLDARKYSVSYRIVSYRIVKWSHVTAAARNCCTTIRNIVVEKAWSIGEWPWRQPKVIRNEAIRRATHHCVNFLMSNIFSTQLNFINERVKTNHWHLGKIRMQSF